VELIFNRNTENYGSRRDIRYFPCSNEQFFKIVSDYERYPEFLSEVKVCKVIETKGNKKLVEFQVSVVKSFTYRLWITEEKPRRISWTLDSGIFSRRQWAHGLEEVVAKRGRNMSWTRPSKSRAWPNRQGSGKSESAEHDAVLSRAGEKEIWITKKTDAWCGIGSKMNHFPSGVRSSRKSLALALGRLHDEESVRSALGDINCPRKFSPPYSAARPVQKKTFSQDWQ